MIQMAAGKRKPERRQRKTTATPTRRRLELIRAVAGTLTRFQDGTAKLDSAASRVVGLDKHDLPLLATLHFAGPRSEQAIREITQEARATVSARLTRLRDAGYVQPVRGTDQLGLSEHAAQWIATIWQPLQQAGYALLDAHDDAQLETLRDFMIAACELQEQHAARVERMLSAPSPSARTRGGLSPAALRRVQLYVDAHLGNSIRIADLAERAELSAFHFARAFKASTGTTPRAYVEARRVDAAQHLIEEHRLTLAQIAFEVGFGSQSRLTNAFGRITGMTPARYRQRAGTRLAPR